MWMRRKDFIVVYVRTYVRTYTYEFIAIQVIECFVSFYDFFSIIILRENNKKIQFQLVSYSNKMNKVLRRCMIPLMGIQTILIGDKMVLFPSHCL